MNHKPLITSLALLMLSPVLARAGMDDIHVVTRLTGIVEVRTLHHSGHRVSFGSWKQVQLHEVLGPNLEVRSAPHASTWLQTGDQVHDPNKLPADTSITYYVLAPHSTVRLNRQGWNLALVQTLQGHVSLKIIHGKIPNATYYKKSPWYQGQFARQNKQR